jgi:hypothetical protein
MRCEADPLEGLALTEALHQAVGLDDHPTVDGAAGGGVFTEHGVERYWVVRAGIVVWIESGKFPPAAVRSGGPSQAPGHGSAGATDHVH